MTERFTDLDGLPLGTTGGQSGSAVFLSATCVNNPLVEEMGDEAFGFYCRLLTYVAYYDPDSPRGRQRLPEDLWMSGSDEARAEVVARGLVENYGSKVILTHNSLYKMKPSGWMPEQVKADLERQIERLKWDSFWYGKQQATRDEIVARLALMTVAETAEQLGMSKAWVTAEAKKGTLPAIRLGHRWMFHPGDVVEFLYERRRERQAGDDG